MKRVVVGLSGGVDSSVAAHLLLEDGYEVIGMFMKNWHDESVTISDECPWIDDSNDALLVADKLGIPFQVIDLSKDYKERIVNYMFNEYENGRTPNPDVLCNREIKFDVFMKAAMELGADYVATGHYCQKRKDEHGKFDLVSGADSSKDQSYFLCQITQDQLSKVLFPIGHLEKKEVRNIARKEGLVTADKKDSQGLCFVGKIKLPEFLQQQLKTKEGEIIEIPEDHIQYKKYQDFDIRSENIEELAIPFTYSPADGKKVAIHNGAHFYTIGQRKGLHVGGRPEPSFVIGIDTDKNHVYTGQTKMHPGLNRYALKLNKSSINWINKENNVNEESYLIRIRYRQVLQKGKLIRRKEEWYILFENMQSAISPGQFAAWYKEDVLIGSGVIDH
ncbi:MAG: tRNA 2-thiouridine(34) synthase MnmA [Crocinitomicaceae bacterium]|jgi:tRNA-uridine 2-sulfurtransferase|nr:tRNA 2-thiouridine(34) synthase MnmA [Crocinitomicaceae bacterium]